MKIVVAISLICIPLCIKAQIKPDTLKPILIHDVRKEIQTSTEQVMDSNILLHYKFQNLQQLLQMNSNVFVKNYGVSNFSTLSIRGSSAAQTTVIWNGISINNALTGISDLSTMPVSFFETMSIQYGSSIHNNSVGGGLVLGNAKPVFAKMRQLSFGAGYESFRNGSGMVQFNYGSNKIFNSLRIFTAKGNNSYHFYNAEKQQQDTLQHAQSFQSGVVNDFHFRVNPRHLLAFHIWAHHTKRDIPPATFESESGKNEKIVSVRSVLNWEYKYSNQLSLNTGVGFVLEKYRYHDSLIQLQSDAKVHQVPFYSKLKWRPLRNHTILVNLMGSGMYMQLPAQKTLSRMGLSVSYGIENILKVFALKALVQKEITDVFQLPLIASLSGNIRILKGVSFYQSFSTNYRMPTLNELYYVPGGNAQLKPETSANVEGGLLIDRHMRKQHISADFSLYSRKVKNWIVWFGNSILTPHNIQEVYSRGVECMWQYEVVLSEKGNIVSDKRIRRMKAQPNRDLKFMTGLFYAYTLSTTRESAIPNDYSIGKQIPYVPRYQVKWNAGIVSEKFDLQYIFIYTGYRFTTTDESIWLLPYRTSNLMAAFKLKSEMLLCNVFAKVNNIFSAPYESIRGRVMPGRNFSIGMNLKVLDSNQRPGKCIKSLR